MQHTVEFLKKRNGRFFWQVVRTVKNSRKIIIQSDRHVDWSSKHGAEKGFKSHRNVLAMMP